MSDKVYNGTVKAVMKNQQGRRKVILSIVGIGDAFIGWNRTPQGVSFPIGAKIQVQMYKHEDGRWLVSEIVSIAGKSLSTQQTGKSNPRKKAKHDTKRSKSKAEGALSLAPPRPRASRENQSRREIYISAGQLRIRADLWTGRE